MLRPIVVLIHHKSYANLWQEPDEDLVALCNRPCHKNVHAVHNGGKFKTLREATDAYIAKERARRLALSTR